MSIKQHVDAMYAMRQSGATWREIAAQFGISVEGSRRVVRLIYPDAMRLATVERQPPKASQFKPVEVDVSRVLAMRRGGMSMQAIGEALGVNKATISRRLKAAGYEIKKQPKRKPGRARFIRMTDAEYKAFTDLGGPAWLRSYLDAQTTMNSPACGVHSNGIACTVNQ